ncbi:MAG: hypothetical protein GY706_03730 [Bacteroides sp.]|nr:hypothetical protein [Bacteroides sp.]
MMHECLNEDIRYKYWLQISKGQSNIPKVLWVSVLPKGKKVYSATSLTACFGINGEGIVVGVMDSVIRPQSIAPSVKRSEENILVDVDGIKPRAKYNDKFLNPLEITKENFSQDEFAEHIRESSILIEKLYEGR